LTSSLVVLGVEALFIDALVAGDDDLAILLLVET
jgi:hypothetical protein